MNQRLITVSAALAIAAAGGFAYAQSDAQSANTNGAPGVEANVGANAKDGGLPGVEMNVGADGDQKNMGSSADTTTLGAGSSDMRVDRN
jgi:hypothetical protein